MDLWAVYDFYWNKCYDPRTIDFPLIRSQFAVPFILLVYLYLVLRYLPNYMKRRKPYNLKKFIKYYNIFQIVSNMLMVQQLISAGWFSTYSIVCEMPDDLYSPNAIMMTKIIYFFFLNKTSDLVETIVFALRKKNNQISFLHLFHHVSMVIISWLITRYIPYAMISFPMMVNSAIHVIMYTYYLLSSFGGSIQKTAVAYKSILTIVQMAQFIVLIIYSTHPFFVHCNMSKVPSTIFIIHLLINFVLFYNFYRKTYVKPACKTN